MRGAIEYLLRDVINILNTDDAEHLIGLSLEEFMQSVYRHVISIQINIIQPVAYTILAIFILLEIQKISTKVEQAGGAPTLGFELVFKALVKLVICKIVVDNVQLILNAILEVGNTLARQILAYGHSSDIMDSVIRTFMDHINDMNFWRRLQFLMILLILSLVATVLRVYIEATLYLRFFELFIFSAIAPLPVATLPNEEFSSIGKNYLKGYVAVGLQGVFLALVMTIYPAILQNLVQSISVGGIVGRALGPWALIVTLLIYMLIVLFTINKTKQWAKSIVNVS